MKLKLENLTTERWNGSYITVKTTIKKNQIDHILAPHHHRFKILIFLEFFFCGGVDLECGLSYNGFTHMDFLFFPP
jgi:hypothetical protein